MILGPTVKFYITGNFEWKKVKVAVGFSNIRIWDGLEFFKLELYVEVSSNNLPEILWLPLPPQGTQREHWGETAITTGIPKEKGTVTCDPSFSKYSMAF